MSTNLTIGDLRKLMSTAKSSWTIDEALKDTEPVPQHPTGADLTKVKQVTAVPRTDIAPYVSVDSSNPFLRRTRIENGLLKASTLAPELTQRMNSVITPAPHPVAAGGVVSASAAGAAAVTAAVTGAAASVDWRTRFGWNWLTNIKDQDPCGSCWVFGSVGVVEAMTRIEHAIWSLRSEGDVHDGMGWLCANGGDPANALDWVKSHGVADPGCWPYETTNLTYVPTSDRAGRTVRLDDYVTLNNIEDQKSWLDNVGPLAACFTVYWDFQAYGPSSGVYICNPASGIDGGHCVMIVGYDDSKKAWLMRNSWGTGWGMAGYCWFGYGQCGIDSNVKLGIPGGDTNPDPWTKRRAHAGNFIESGNGTLHRNFETWSLGPAGAIRHYWRDGNTLAWALAETQGNDCEVCPTVTATTYNRNFEMVYWTTANRLHHRYYDQGQAKWFDGPIFGPTNVAGVPGFIQSDWGSLAQPEKTAGPAGNFELVVRIATGQLVHWWRNDSATGYPWAQTVAFGSNIAHSGRSLIQRFDRGLDVVAVNNDGTMQRYWRDDAHDKPWAAAEKFGSGVKSPPVMIRSQYGAGNETTPGNYELLVAVNGAVQHWWTAGNAPANWTHDETFGSNIEEVIGLIQSSFGFDLEAVVLLTNGSLQHYWRSAGNLQWYAGPVYGTTH
jgi:C1A family cysteine protease